MGMSEPAGHIDRKNGSGIILICHTAGAIDRPYIASLQDVYISGVGHTFEECARNLIDHMRKVADELEQTVNEKYGTRAS